MGGRLARARRRLRHRAGQRESGARFSPPDLENRAFIERATTGFEEYRASVEPYTLGVRRAAHRRSRGARFASSRTRTRGAERAQLCWTLGITEHHNAVDNVRALINLALLTGHVGRYGSGVCPLRGQNNVQGGGDMGAIPEQVSGRPKRRGPGRAARSSSARGAPHCRPSAG